MRCLFIFVDRVISKFLRTYRNYIFYVKTGCRANLIGNMTLINRNVKCGKNVTIYPGVMFFGDGRIEIGDNVDIGNGTIIYASKCGGVSIGSNTVIAAQCYIIDMDHGIEKNTLIREQPNTVDKVIIGSDCWLAANVTVLKGSHICDGAVVGAKSLVKNVVEANSVVVGVPCKKMKMRS